MIYNVRRVAVADGGVRRRLIAVPRSRSGGHHRWNPTAPPEPARTPIAAIVTVPEPALVATLPRLGSLPRSVRLRIKADTRLTFQYGPVITKATLEEHIDLATPTAWLPLDSTAAAWALDFFVSGRASAARRNCLQQFRSPADPSR